MPVNNFLTAVMRERRQDAQRASQKTSLITLKQQVAAGTVGRSLQNAWRRQRTAATVPWIIAEVKKASPSAGLLCRDYHPEALARDYEKAGAAAISVLTEPRHFLGSDADLRMVRRAVGLPVLRKDFICEPYQIYESAVLGADIVLLIAAALDARDLRVLVDLAVDIGLEALVEVHTLEELEQAVLLEKAIVGVNSRDLVTLKTDLSVARRLAPYLPQDRLCIAESGIRNRRDIEALQAVGYRGFLIGEALMKSPDAGEQLRSFLAPAVQ
ncbi:MAG: indole-3-glycerol phosphate synthase TrpC [Verrucomicrobia bacterium]|nr:indole-3-glycerol phosphate synthase TrpC [Verrucomicrobiota bacterium]MCG2680843.1 indole-3-glycerol phosphate synthase TrpC [Kiritimatiellia bacterium]MBU4246853.1 indole-3-glycerol phosphate synthase TrpC [Verrucomicrobiota bacterium]MBU4290401.1 indole-3-glycerol phosphate synthase TrpC [Verrucomicrobiota bacterium]MBU4430252.1 indole-3-glycerol phosphate synthase TrpC [Verrucomicrobiota bacterium]